MNFTTVSGKHGASYHSSLHGASAEETVIFDREGLYRYDIYVTGVFFFGKPQ